MSIRYRKILLAVLALTIALVPALRRTGLLFLTALLCSTLLEPALVRLERRHIPRWLGTALLLLGILAPLGGLGWFVGRQLLGQVRELPRLLPYLRRAEDALDGWLYLRITALSPDLQRLLTSALDTAIEQRNELLGQFLQWFGGIGAAWLRAVPAQIGSALFFLLILVLCCTEYGAISSLLKQLLPRQWHASLGELHRSLCRQLGAWLRAQRTLVGLILLELTAGLLVLRMEGWYWRAPLIALVDLLPLVGSGLILLPWAGMLWLTARPAAALALVLLWLIVWCTRTLLEPKLVGQRLQIPAALSLCSALAGVRLWGIKGLILFPVLCAVGVGLIRSKKSGAVPKDSARSGE